MRTIIPPKEYTAENVKSIRMSTGLPQDVFALAIGIAPETLRGWEQGHGKPDVAASRILYAIELDRHILDYYVH